MVAECELAIYTSTLELFDFVKGQYCAGVLLYLDGC